MPVIVHVADLMQQTRETDGGDGVSSSSSRGWVLARALPFTPGPIRTFRIRLSLAIAVFKGRYDVLDWR